MVMTGSKSFANIAFGENIIRVMENSSIEITKAVLDKTAGTENTELSIKEGKLFSRVGRKLVKGDLYLVKTPTTVASVRGTNFLVASYQGKSSVSCLNGKIEVQKNDDPKAEPVEVKEGEGIAIEIGKEIEIKKLSDDEIAMLLDIVESIEGDDTVKAAPLSNRPFPDYDIKH